MAMHIVLEINPGPAEPGYSLPLETVDPDQLASDLKMHCLLIQITIHLVW